MGLPHSSVPTIDNPEFINLQPTEISPLISKCDIKVFYLGENRNFSNIDKKAALKIAKTLRGNPIVAAYKKEKEDYSDHGERIVIEEGKIKEECTTVPYGYVAPNARVWFKDFIEQNESGEDITRTYLMTEGYLWTGQYEEAKLAFDGGRPESMELDDEYIQGEWKKNNKGIDFFIINDAIITKLCMLGEDVEPCFEGSSIEAPIISTSFSKLIDENFIKTMSTMMKELTTALEGGLQMSKEEKKALEVGSNETNFNLKFDEDGGNDSEADIEAAEAATAAAEALDNVEAAATEIEGALDDIDDTVEAVIAPTIEADVAEIAIQDSIDTVNTNLDIATVQTQEAQNQADIADAASKKEGATEAAAASALDAQDSADDAADALEQIQESISLVDVDNAIGIISDIKSLPAKKVDYELEYNQLKESYEKLEKEVIELRNFKLEKDNFEKDKLFGKYSMIASELVEELKANKEKYSYKDLEKELSYLYTQNCVSFNDSEEENNLEINVEKNNSSPVTTFNLNNTYNYNEMPSWVSAVQAMKKKCN